MNLLYYIVISYIIISCSGDYNKDVEYGNCVFLAQDDGLITFDELTLYDNDIFNINTLDTKANGTYRINGDTLFLDYYILDKCNPQTFLRVGEHIYKIDITNRVDKNYSMLIYENNLWN